MLFAFEGPPAVGKTRWLQEFPGTQALGLEDAPSPPDPLTPESVAERVAWSEDRWRRMLEIEKRYGRAYVDTDPLGLHVAFALTVMGEAPRTVFDEAYRKTRAAMAAKRLGFVEKVVVLTATPEKLTERAEADEATERPDFETRRMIGPPMEAFYHELEYLRPGSVHVVSAESEIRKTGVSFIYRFDPHTHPRYDVASLDALKDALDLLIPALTA